MPSARAAAEALAELSAAKFVLLGGKPDATAGLLGAFIAVEDPIGPVLHSLLDRVEATAPKILGDPRLHEPLTLPADCQPRWADVVAPEKRGAEVARLVATAENGESGSDHRSAVLRHHASTAGGLRVRYRTP